MRRSRLVLVSLVSVIALALTADPVVAQSSTTARLINELNNKLMLIAVPITLLVEGILIYTVLRFKDADEAKSTEENRKLEITWTVATAVVLLFVGVASYGVLAHEDVTFESDEQAVAPEDDDVVVHMQAFQWGWQASYPEEGVSISSTSPTVVIPQGQDVYFNITSSDVIHSFHVPALGLKQDAMPGQYNVIRTVPLETGTYQGYCAEFCGVAHSQMYFEIKVVSSEEYRSYIQEQRSSSSDVEIDASVDLIHARSPA